MTQVEGAHPKAASRALNIQKHIAHRLLIELLACQFAFPVRWIETQDELLSREDAISRFIEIGPAKVLTRMAKQSTDINCGDRDLARYIQRKFLSSKSDAREIWYEYDSVEEMDTGIPQEEPVSTSAQTSPVTTEQPPIPAPAPRTAAVQVPDIPVSALEIVRILLARKLNRKYDGIPTTQSIGDLTGGKSTLQNELVGILEAEFSNLPPASEDLSISQLGESLQLGFSGNLGKESSRLISRFFSAKAPASFSISDVKAYLERTWGLGSGRQSLIFLLAVTNEPQSRFPSIDSAKDFFDSTAKWYASLAGLDLSKTPASNGQQHPTSSLVDTKHVEALLEEKDEHLVKYYKILGDHLGIDPSNNSKIQDVESQEQKHRSKLALWSSEFEDEFEAGIRPLFDTRKIRRFNSWWNNVRQDLIGLFYGTQDGTKPIEDLLIEEKILLIANRCDDFVCKLLDYFTKSTTTSSSSTANGFKSIAPKLSQILATAKDTKPVFKYTHKSMAPQTIIDQAGVIRYREIPRHKSNGSCSYTSLLRRDFSVPKPSQQRPLVDVQTRCGNQWQFDSAKTGLLLEALDQGASSGISFAGKDVLLTGAGPKSIGAEVLRGLLMGGARVIVTTSRPPSETKGFFQDLYTDYGARGSELTVLPFNQGSKRDCIALIDHIYSESGMGRNLDVIIPFAAISERAEIDRIGSRSELAHRLMLVNVLRILGEIVQNKSTRDFNTRPTQVILPLSPNHGIFGGDGLYTESKLGLEGLMNRFYSETWSDYLHICGAVIGWTRGTELMSDNDTLAESIESQGALTFSQKEMAFNLLTLLTDPMAELCERDSILVNLNGCLDAVPDLKNLLVKTRNDLNQKSSIRKAIVAEDKLEEKALNNNGVDSPFDGQVPGQMRRSTIKVGYPTLPDFQKEIEPLHRLGGMVDLRSVPVIVGFSELGPWGSARTRWEMESKGTFSQEGFIEMAWMMNLIKYFSGNLNGKHYSGWVDAKSNTQVRDDEVGKRYSNQILKHSGIRLVEPELFGGYEPRKKEYLQEVAIEADLPEFDASRAAAEAFKLYQGDKVSIRRVDGSDEYKVQLKRGASVMVSKAVPFEGLVAGQIPTGWDAARYGIPEDIIQQVDPVTAYALCCTAEALYSAGISDASEILQHCHLSEIGNFVGSMMGATTKVRNMYKDRFLDKDVQGDVMQETYLNTTAAWINMLLLGVAGPIKTPTGACATGIESIDNACESLLSGKTKICIAGGTDDFQEEESFAFRTMNATVNAHEEFAQGRVPAEMSRPTSESRTGFVEGQGSGIQILTTAELALNLGLPIYGVIAASTMAADKISRSVPAPGQGILSFARETPKASLSPLLSLEYRRREMAAAIDHACTLRRTNLRAAHPDFSQHSKTRDDEKCSEDETRLSPSMTMPAIGSEITPQIREIRRLWGNDFRRQEPDISPLRASLATWGLTIDDINFVSLHATSTKANDKNEPEIINKQMSHLKRTVGNPLLAVCQKSLTGHPKAPAASFMLNGCLQSFNTGIIPGNRTADNVDPILSAYPHLTFPTRSIQIKDLKAFSLTSFGFGQKGGQLIGIHPRFLYAALDDHASFESYAVRFTSRTRRCNRAYIHAMLENQIVACKEAPQYAPADQDAVLLDPHSRISARTPKGETWRYELGRPRFDQHNISAESGGNSVSSESDDPATSQSSPSISPSSSSSSLDTEMMAAKTWLEGAAAGIPQDQNVSVGFDVESLLSTDDADLHGSFVKRNYTEAERTIVASNTNPQRALTGRWSAKEAVFKSLGIQGRGAGAAMKDIEILSSKEGKPIVKLHAGAHRAACENGITEVHLSLSYKDDSAIAVALAVKGASKASY